MRAGQLKETITIISRSVDDAGTATDTTIGTVRARVEPLSGREQTEAMQNTAYVSHRITIRYLSGVKPTHIVQLGSQTLAIESVIDTDNRHREMTLLCSEVIR